MEYVTLTRWEWQILCAQGSIRMLAARICEIPQGQPTFADAQKLFALAPQFNLGDAHAFVIAELLPEWRMVGPPSEVGLSNSLKSLHLEAVKCFFPITTAEVEDLQEKAMAGAILLDAPKFEGLWRDWVSHQTHVMTRRSAEKFVAVLGLGEWIPNVSKALNPRTATEIDTSVLEDDLIGVFLDSTKKILKHDEARSEEGTCAHAITCATVWASLFSNRPIPVDGSDLQKKLVTRLNRYREQQYGNADYLTLGLHHELQALVQEAPGAFDKSLTPISVGIYLRFAVAIQFGPPPQPSHLVAAILRLQDLDGGLAAAICAYLIGLKLKLQLVHQIAMGLNGDKFPVVDKALTEEALGLVSIGALRRTIAAPMFDFDASGNDVSMPENSSELHNPIEVSLFVEKPAADPGAEV
jgi:hypothetical protein